MPKTMNRRDFGRACAGFAVLALAGTGRARAADLPQVDPAAAQASALGYVHDAATVDTAKFPGYVAGNNCAGCALYQGGAAEWGPCGLFPGQAVSAKGWCSAFAKKPA